MLEAIQLECVRGERRLFRDVSFALAPGTLLEVVGPNGSGKTSLLRILCGLSPAESGEILWHGESVKSLGDAWRATLLYLGHANGIKDDLTGVENIVFTETLAGQAVNPKAAAETLGELGLAGFEHLPTRVLSQGQKRRVALSRLAFRAGCRVWILDEPFVALDVAAVKRIATTISDQLADGGIVVLTTHQEVEIAAPKRSLMRLGLPS